MRLYGWGITWCLWYGCSFGMRVWNTQKFGISLYQTAWSQRRVNISLQFKNSLYPVIDSGIIDIACFLLLNRSCCWERSTPCVPWRFRWLLLSSQCEKRTRNSWYWRTEGSPSKMNSLVDNPSLSSQLSHCLGFTQNSIFPLKVATIIRNLSFEVNNMEFLASSIPLFR